MLKYNKKKNTHALYACDCTRQQVPLYSKIVDSIHGFERRLLYGWANYYETKQQLNMLANLSPPRHPPGTAAESKINEKFSLSYHIYTVGDLERGSSK